MNEFWQWFNNYADPKLGNRRITFRKMFEHLDKFKDPIIIETGCIRFAEGWIDEAWAGDGCSTILFDKYVSFNGGHFWSVDIGVVRVQHAEKLMGKNSQISCGDSVELLRNFANDDRYPTPHLVYLDSWDFEWYVATESQAHHYNELKAIFPKLTPDTLVVVDDSPVAVDEEESYVVGGKGSLVSRYAGELGVPLAFSGYQSGWLGFPGIRTQDDKSPEHLLIRAKALIQNGKWIEAYPLYKRIYIGVKTPSNNKENRIYGEACAYFGRAASASSRYGTAYDWFQRASAADPDNIDYRLEMIIKAMKPLGWLSVARSEAIRISEIAPDNPIVWCVLGQIEAELNNANASLAAYSKFIEKSDKSTFSLLTKATFLVKTEQYEEAETLCDIVISRNESLGDTFVCKGMILSNCGDHEGAIKLFEEAINHGCQDNSMVLYFLSLSLFSVGRFREGWQAVFRARLENTSFGPLYGSMRRFTKPLKQMFVMQPPPAIGHVHPDAGEGDNLLLLRYLPLLASKGYVVRYEARDGAFKLVQDSFPNLEVIPLASDFPGTFGIPDFDYHLAIVDLPFIFQTDIDTVPWYGPYIKADPELVEKYRAYKGKIGIVWSTGAVNWDHGVRNQSYSFNKSISFDLLKPIIDINPSMFVSLQGGAARTANNNIIA